MKDQPMPTFDEFFDAEEQRVKRAGQPDRNPFLETLVAEQAREKAAANPYMRHAQRASQPDRNPYLDLIDAEERKARQLPRTTYDEAVDSVLRGEKSSVNHYLDTAGAQERERSRTLEEAVDQVLDYQRTVVRGTAFWAAQTDPEHNAKARQLAKRTGIPDEVIARNLMDVKVRDAVEEIAYRTNQSPRLEQMMMEKIFAGMAHDDVSQLADLEARIAQFGELKAWSGPKPGVVSVAKGLASNLDLRSVRESLRMQIGDAMGLPTNDAQRTFNQLKARSDALTPEFETATGRAVYGGFASLTRQVPGIAASILTANPVPALAYAGSTTQAEAYGKYRERGAKPSDAFVGSIGEGAVEVATELMPMGYLVKSFGKVGAKQFLAGLVGREIPSEQVATFAQDAIDTAVANPDKTWGEFWAERPDAAYQTLISTIVQAGAMGGLSAAARRYAGRQQRAEQSLHHAEAVASVMETAKASKLKNRDPEQFAAFVQGVADDAGTSEVFIDARTLVSSLEQSGVNVEQLAQQMPSLGEQLGEALATGGDLVVPVGELTAHLSDHAAAVLPHLRTEPDAVSLAESQAFHQDAPEQLRAEAEALVQAVAVPATAGPATVRDQLVDQLRQANRFTPEVNAAYADLGEAFYTATAARMGTTPEALFESLPLRVVAENVFGTALDQAPSVSPEPTAASPGATVSKPGQPAEGVAPLPALEQAQGVQPAAPRGAYEPDSNTIALLRGADLSTFLHEGAHAFLEMTAQLSMRPEAPAEVQQDMRTVLDWAGFAGSVQDWMGRPLDERRAAHEKFARGFEAYAFEGKAPSVELADVFRRFAAWLKQVYKRITSLNVELNDEVRGVFDRMLATDAQIKEAQAARQYAPLFESAEAAGMTADEWAAYQRMGQEATDSAVDDLQRRSLGDMKWLSNAKARKLRELQRDAAGKRKAIQAEVAVEVDATPLEQARRHLKALAATDPEVKAAVKAWEAERQNTAAALRDQVKAEYLATPEGAATKGIKRGQFLAKNKRAIDNEAERRALEWERANPRPLKPKAQIAMDFIADMFGFSSGDHLKKALADTPTRAQQIEALTDQRMLERYGDLVDDRALDAAANAALHNDVRARFLEREANQLAKAVGSRPILTRAARMYAESSIAAKKLRDIRPAVYSAAEARAGRAAAQAFKDGNTAQAAQLKRDQVLNDQLARVATKARDEAEKAVDYLRKFDSAATRQAIGADYADQIDALLERYDLRASVSDKAIARRKSLGDWIEAQRELGFEPVIDEALLADIGTKHFREMTLEELRGLRDAVKNIEHLGRLKQRLLTVQDQRAFDEIVTAASDSIKANATKTRRQALESHLPRDRAGKLLSQYLMSHRKLASLVRQMDGGKDGGALWSFIVRPMNEAGNREAVMREQATLALQRIFAPLLKEGGLYDKTYIPAIGTSLTKMGRLSVALNWGNQTNRQRLMDGEGWNQQQVQAILDTLSARDWQFVQAVWDHLNSYWPQVAAKEKRVSGIEPEKVEAVPVHTAFGELRGGYFPIKYDAERSTRAESDSMAEVIKQSMQGLYTRATTRRGHTKARTETVRRPLRLSFDTIFTHVDQVVHDLSWHEFLIDANRLIRARPIDAAIRNHYGPDALRALSGTLEDIAKGDIPAQNAFEAALNHLRAGVSIAGMGWSLTTAALQPLGFTQSAVRIGPKWLGRGLARWLGDAVQLENTVAEVYGKSEMMRLRGKTMSRELAEIRNVVDADGGKLATVKNTYFYFLTKMQMVVDVPTWLGAYEKALDTGVDDAKAVALADQAVLDSQGGGQIKDLAAIQRGSPLQKLFTAFYSYFSTTYNLTAERVGATNFKDPLSVGRLAVDTLLLYTVPAVLGVLLRSALRGDDDDEDLGKTLAREQLNYLLGTLVGVRELSAAVSGAFGYQGPAGTRFFSSVADFSKQVAQGEIDEAALRALNQTAGILFHYPAAQVQRTVEGVTALTEGEEDADLRALAFGPPKR